jgi:hypothetical protein
MQMIFIEGYNRLLSSRIRQAVEKNQCGMDQNCGIRIGNLSGKGMNG